MIIQLVLWIFEFFVLILYGRLLLRILKALCKPSSSISTSLELTFLTGLALVTSLASVLSLMMKLSAPALAIITAGALLALVVEWRSDRFSSLKAYFPKFVGNKTWLLVSLGVLGLILDLSTRRTTNPDTGIYHAQAIHWIEAFPAVPGLGNLHSRFAFNSSWLVANALFSFAFTGIQSFHALPGLLYLVFGFSGLAGIRRIFERRSALSDWLKALLLPLSFFAFASEVSSPGTDLPAILLSWMILTEWMVEKESPGQDGLRPVLIGLLAVFAITIKLSVIPVVLFAVLMLIQMIQTKHTSQVAVLLVGGLLILLPWFARNMVYSGYLVYPEPAVDLFNPDWKIPEEMAVREQEVIQAWARIPREDADLVEAMPLAKWAKTWYFNQRRSSQAMLWGIGLGPLTIALAAVSRKARAAVLPEIRRYGMGNLIFLAGLFFWFLSAPDLRFGYGFILAALVIGWLPWVVILRSNLLPSSRWIAWLLMAAILLLWARNYRTIGPHTFLQRILIPADYTSMSTAPCELKNKTILCAQWYDECGYSAFPCVPAADPEVGLRGAEFSQGFRRFSP